MRALTVLPGFADSVEVSELPEPIPSPGELLVAPLSVGVCGTDREIVAGTYGAAPPGDDRLVIGHEAVARVLAAPAEGTFEVGDLVVPIVRRPDPVPCPACAAGEWDMCENGRYTEHGIAGAHGFAAERAALDPAFVARVPGSLGLRAVLVEPASVVAKAWEQIQRIGHRAHRTPRIVLITGAGTIGLLAALMARQRGYVTHLLDRVTDGPKPALVHRIGGTYHVGAMADVEAPDIVIECTGVGALVLDAIEHTRRNGIVCLTGISSGARVLELDVASMNRRLVLENDVVFGTVNANRRHYEAGVQSLSAGPSDWLDDIVTRRVPLRSWQDAFAKREDDVKVCLDLTD